MALQQSTIFRGLTAAEGYFKIQGYRVWDQMVKVDPEAEAVKTFFIVLKLDLFVDGTKENLLDTKEHSFNTTIESELTLGNFYTFLKAKGEFSTSIDV